MRKKKYENFIAKLMMTKDIIDAAELEKHIRNVVGYDKSSLEKEYFPNITNQSIDARHNSNPAEYVFQFHSLFHIPANLSYYGYRLK